MVKLNVGQDLIDFFYPIGCIYTSMNSTSPETLFGGEWTQITDKFLYCTTSSKGTGGSSTHKHTTGNHTLTVSEIPNHTHKNWIVTQALWSYSNQYGQWGNLARASDSGSREEKDNYSWNEGTGGGNAHNHGDTGSSSNLPPYMTCYAWYRTA